MITIIDYGAGNIKSVANMLRAIGVESQISGDPSVISEAQRIILPGVGHFDYGMSVLAKRGISDALSGRVIDGGTPFLGICLGAQLLTRGSEEGELPGLGWIEADTVSFDRTQLDERLKLPVMGWVDVQVCRNNPLIEYGTDSPRFYHVHKFHLQCDSADQVILRSHYGYDYVTGIQSGNILGVQFHPEKSHRFGMDILKRFAAWTPGHEAS
ncbi:MAG: imidazole glycerol phosphate synthase subunit HisH [Pseudomonadota bacterium]